MPTPVRASNTPFTTEIIAPKWLTIASNPSRGRPRCTFPSRPRIGQALNPRSP